jgi:hypothetical protein
VAGNAVLALQHLHYLGIIYRGLNALTLLVTEAGLVQLVDFRWVWCLLSEVDFRCGQQGLGQGESGGMGREGATREACSRRGRGSWRLLSAVLGHSWQALNAGAGHRGGAGAAGGLQVGRDGAVKQGEGRSKEGGAVSAGRGGGGREGPEGATCMSGGEGGQLVDPLWLPAPQASWRAPGGEGWLLPMAPEPTACRHVAKVLHLRVVQHLQGGVFGPPCGSRWDLEQQGEVCWFKW